MMIPLVKSLQYSFPEAKITWIIGEGFHPLLQELPEVEFLPITKVRTFKDMLQIRKRLQGRRFDYLLATQASFSAHLIYPLIKADCKIGYDRFRSKDFHGLFVDERIEFHKEHTVDGFIRFAKHIGAKEVVYDGSFPIPKEDEEFPSRLLPQDQPYCVINPLSSKREKDWLFERYRTVIRYLENRGLRVVLTGGKTDFSYCESLKLERGESGVMNLAGKTSLRELTALLKGAKFVLSPDTGPMHIASAFQVPLIALFATTSSLLTGPFFPGKEVIDHHPTVLERLASSKERKKGWNVRIYHPDAMAFISVEEVISRIEKLL